MAMKKWFVLTMLALTVPAAPALSEPGSEQQQVRRDIREGNILKLEEIKRRVLRTRPNMQYADQQYFSEKRLYRLRFIKNNGEVILVDVDARSGAIISSSDR